MHNFFQGLKASESVTTGHPDKICDRIAARILDEAIRVSRPLKGKPRVALEVSAKGNLATGGTLLLFGEVSLPKGATLDYAKIARETIRTIGYTDPSYGFWYGLDELLIRISEQSQDIDSGVSHRRIGAGDQGFMIGGAVLDGPELMPTPITLAHALTTEYTRLFQSGQFPFLRPDAKSQVIVRYEDGVAKEVEHVTFSASHSSDTTVDDIREFLKAHIIHPVLDRFSFRVPKNTFLALNRAGAWTTFGPLADAGTTNRKIVVDTYGGYFPIGGGGLNGKDPTKVDISGAVATRYIAKSLAQEFRLKQVQVEVSYAIGHPDPLGMTVFGEGHNGQNQKVLYDRAQRILYPSVENILKQFDLYQPIYEAASVGGFFGRTQFPWEQTTVNSEQ